MRIIAVLLALTLALPAQQIIIAKKKAAPGGSPPAFVSCVAADSGGASGTSQQTGAANLATGNAVFVIAGFKNACSIVTGSITDLSSGSNTFTQIPCSGGNCVNTYYVQDGALNVCSSIWYAKNTSAVTNNQYTVTWSGTVDTPSIAVLQMSGASTTAPLDATPTAGATGGGFGTTATTGTFNVAANSLAVFGSNIYGISRTPTADTGYQIGTGCTSSSQNSHVTIQYKQFTGSATGETNTITWSGAASLITNLGATFK
jgi:hypothetical protein